MNESAHFEIGEGRLLLRFAWRFQGTDLHLHISGGDDHIGAVALAGRAEDGTTDARVLLLAPHREDELVRGAAMRLHEALGSAACVTAGVHLDQARAEEIQTIIRRCEAGVSQLIRILAERKPG